jgi:hypothetical protein
VSVGQDHLDVKRVGDIAAHPLYLNPHIRMCAVITRAIAKWGGEAESLLRSTYRRLGRKTGNFVIAAGVVRRGATVAEWGRVSEEIMDLNGLGGWSRVEVSEQRHDLEVPACKRYTEAYRALGAPRQLCSIPFEWDNGCLDAVNPELQVWPGPCAYQGAASCHYVIDRRPEDQTAQTRDALAADDYSVGPVEAPTASRDRPVEEAPDWTNPLVGLLAIVSAIDARWGEEGEAEVRTALGALGVLAGRYLLANRVVPEHCTPADWLTFADGLWEVAGFYHRRMEVHSADEASIVLDDHPYLEPLTFFKAPANLFDAISDWDRGCLSVVSSGVKMTWEECAWRDGTASSRVSYSR